MPYKKTTPQKDSVKVQVDKIIGSPSIASASAKASADKPLPAVPATPDSAAKEEKPSTPGVAVEVRKNEPDEIVLAVGDREYRVRGLAKNTGFESLRVSLRAACGDERKIAGVLVIRRDVALADAGAGKNPLVRGIHDGLEVAVGQNFFGQITASADNFER